MRSCDPPKTSIVAALELVTATTSTLAVPFATSTTEPSTTSKPLIWNLLNVLSEERMRTNSFTE